MADIIPTSYDYTMKWQKKRSERQRLKAAKQASQAAARGAQRESRAADNPVGQLTGTVAEIQGVACTVMVGQRLVPCDLNEATLPSDAASLVVGDRVTLDVEDGRG